MSDAVSDRLRELFAGRFLELGHPAGGATPDRLAELAHFARTEDMSVARLIEAHTDAASILHEAGRTPQSGAVYGVWASQTTTAGVRIDDGGVTISGSMGFASGLGIVDRALVTVAGAGGSRLVDVDVSLGHDTLVTHSSSWSTPAMAATSTGPVSFERHPIDRDLIVGGPGWYLSRPGFWQGACAPAACWAGGALGVVDAAADLVDDDPHRLAHHGAMAGHAWQLNALIDAAGRRIDTEPHSSNTAEQVARSLRFVVADVCRDVMDRFARAFGPRPVVQHAAIAQRILDLGLYITQHHAERELPQLSSLVHIGRPSDRTTSKASP